MHRGVSLRCLVSEGVATRCFFTSLPRIGQSRAMHAVSGLKAIAQLVQRNPPVKAAGECVRRLCSRAVTFVFGDARSRGVASICYATERVFDW
jgi:hypothetical protein